MIERPPSLWRRKVEERALRPPTEPNSNPDVAPSTVGESTDEPGVAQGFMLTVESEPTSSFSTSFTSSPWSGWPETWATPLLNGRSRLSELVDTAWAAVDLNASLLSTMPPYRLRNGEILPATTWMQSPDPDLYSSWEEFAKQVFWSYQLGEVFILATAWDANGWPARFHVIQPWLVNAEMVGGLRRYSIGSIDVTDDVLHVRYQSTTEDARGHGPLEAGASRVVAAGLLSRYATNIASTGGVPHYVLKHEKQLTAKQADDLLHQWWEARTNHLGLPGVLSGGVEIESIQMTPRDMALLELAQFNESRIAVLLGVPPFLLGLPSGGDSMTYSNVTALFDYHWRAGLRPKASPVMAALSAWALPRGQTVELNRDEYVRPGFGERVAAWSTLHGITDDSGRAITAEEIRRAERLSGTSAAAIMTGGAIE